MSTPNLNILLTATIANYDNQVANTPLLSIINPGGLPFGSAGAFRYDDFPAAITGNTVNVPAVTNYIVWVRNRSATGSLTVAVTFVTIGLQQCSLGPGDVYLYFNAAKTSGFTALTVTGVGSTIPCEIFVAA